MYYSCIIIVDGPGENDTELNQTTEYPIPERHLMEYGIEPSGPMMDCFSPPEMSQMEMDEIPVSPIADTKDPLNGIERAILSIQFIAQHMENLDNFYDVSNRKRERERESDTYASVV